MAQNNHYEKAKLYLRKYQIDSAYIEMCSAMKSIRYYTKPKSSSYYVVYAEILKHMSKADSSLFYLLKAKKWYQETKNLDSIIYTSTFEAELHRSLDNRNESIALIKDLTEKVDPKQLNPDILAYFYNRKLAVQNFYVGGDSLKINEQLIQQIYALEPKILSKDIIAYTINEEGSINEIYYSKDKALATYEKAYNYAHENRLIIPEIDILLNIGRSQIRYKDNLKAGIESFKKAEDLALKINSYWQLYIIYIELKDAYRLDGDMEQAYNYSIKMYETNQYLNYRLNTEKVKAIERKYSIEIKEKEITLKNNELSQASKRFWYLIIVLIMISVVVLILIVSYRKKNKTNKQLDMLSKDNEFLLKEANHRINNNLQLIMVLIHKELKKSDVHEVNQINKILSNVSSIATLHRHLYKGDDKNFVDISDYFNEIKTNLSELFVGNDIETVYDIEDLLVQTDVALYLGLIVTELCINSLKHAFTKTQNDKQITIHLESADTHFVLDYSDNGKLSKGKKIQPVLIDKLCKQVKAKYSISTEEGFRIEITIPSNHK